MDRIDLLNASKDAFIVSNQIIGIVSGGAEAPRKLLDAFTINDTAILKYTYQDGVYHDTRKGKVYCEEYMLNDNELSLKGKDTLFPIDKDDPFFDLAEPYIKEFCEEYDVLAKGV